MISKWKLAGLLLALVKIDFLAEKLIRELQSVEEPMDQDEIQDDIADTLSALRVLRSEGNSLARRIEQKIKS